jgi:hypothetical protein
MADSYKQANIVLKEVSSRSIGIEDLLKMIHLSTQYCKPKMRASKIEANGTSMLWKEAR